MRKPIKVLQVAAIDTTVHFLLKPLLGRLREEGYEVHIACSPGPRLLELEEQGYFVHPISLVRKVAFFSNVKSLWHLYQLMRRERFAVVHVHTPVAAALGRIAAKLTQTPVIIYTAHGFYFHELMSRRVRRALIWIERWFGRFCTSMLFLQSAEDAETAIRERIMPEEKVVWIGNGVDPQLFGLAPDETLRAELALPPKCKVVGFIGRLVREKGVEELFAAMGKVVRQFPAAKLLVVGDTLESDRDRRAIERLNELIADERLQSAIMFAGFREDVAELLATMDVFVLPSHREGMPRTVLEAMAAGKPAIVTDIRGCREEVIPGVTGLLVPVQDPAALANAILEILSDEGLACRLGEAGRRRVEAEFDEAAVLQRQIEVYRELLAPNLWIFNHYAVTPDLPGGTRHFDLARELAKRGWQVTIFASSFQHQSCTEAKLSRKEKWKLEQIGGVRFVWIRTFSYKQNDWRRMLNMISYMIRSWRLGRKLPKMATGIGKPDAIIGSSVHLLAVAAAWKVAQHYSARYIMEVRDLWPQTLVDMGRLRERSFTIKLLRALEGFLYREGDLIITLLPRANEYIKTRGISDEKIVWIPNGVDLLAFERRDRVCAVNTPFVVMYLGAHGEANALDVLLEAARILGSQDLVDVRFVLIGNGSEKPRLVRQASALALKNVEFRDSVAKSEVPVVLQEADATVFILNELPLYRYGVSLNKMFDYLASGKPLILAGDPINDPAKEVQCGLSVPPANPQALAEAVLQLARTSSQERVGMGARGRKYVEAHHAMPMLADRLARHVGDL